MRDDNICFSQWKKGNVILGVLGVAALIVLSKFITYGVLANSAQTSKLTTNMAEVTQHSGKNFKTLQFSLNSLAKKVLEYPQILD